MMDFSTCGMVRSDGRGRFGETRIAVVGAGVAGLVTAARLAENGVVVEIFERSPSLGRDAASFLAGGMLAPFCEAENADASIVEPGLEGINWWAGAVPGVERNGTLVVAPWRDRADLSRFSRRTCGYVRIDADRLAEIEPDLAGRFSEALFFPDEAHLDPRRALNALVDGVEAAGGAIHLGRPAAPQDLAEAAGFHAVIDARGIAAAGGRSDLRAVRGEMVVLRCEEISLARPVRLLHPRSPIYVVPREDHRFMVGATTVESSQASGVTLRGAVDLLNAAYALHPAFAEAEIVETGAGLRPAYPDNLPQVRKDGRVVSINGFYRHGFLLSPAAASKAVSLSLGETVAASRMRAAS